MLDFQGVKQRKATNTEDVLKDVFKTFIKYKKPFLKDVFEMSRVLLDTF